MASTTLVPSTRQGRRRSLVWWCLVVALVSFRSGTTTWKTLSNYYDYGDHLDNPKHEVKDNADLSLTSNQLSSLEDSTPETNNHATSNIIQNTTENNAKSTLSSDNPSRTSTVLQEDAFLEKQLPFLDLQTPAMCGILKCFFHLQPNYTSTGYVDLEKAKRNNVASTINRNETVDDLTEPSRVGYLISILPMDHSGLSKLKEGWQFAKTLEKNFGIRHFYYEEPFQTSRSLTKLEAEQLNSNLQGFTMQVQHQLEKSMEQGLPQRFVADQPLLVQPSWVAPTPSVMITCTEPKFSQIQNDFYEFVQQNIFESPTWTSKSMSTSISENISSSVQPLPSSLFAKKFKKEISQLHRVINAEPCLLFDFQVLLDTSGNIYHLDFDRCWKNGHKRTLPSTRKAIQGCVEKLQVLHDWVSSQHQNNSESPTR